MSEYVPTTNRVLETYTFRGELSLPAHVSNARMQEFHRWLATIQPSPDDPATVERVARAVYGVTNRCPTWNAITGHERDLWRSHAHAVLAAITGGK